MKEHITHQLSFLFLMNKDVVIQTLILLGCVALIVVIGFLRIITGPEYALSLLFLIPIMIADWYGGVTIGIAFSAFSAFSWFVADYVMLDHFSSIWVPVINEGMRLVAFLLVVVVLDRLKTAVVVQKQLADTDSLTGLLNRRGFMTRSRIELNRFRRNKRPFTLVYLDIDHFKHINDSLGHETGDTLLKKVSRVLKTKTRSVDTVARSGGDEFIMMLTDTSNEQAPQLVEKIHELLKKQVGSPFEKITFSFGVTTIRRDDQSIESLIDEADQAMYFAKKHGRDRIIYSNRQ